MRKTNLLLLSLHNDDKEDGKLQLYNILYVHGTLKRGIRFKSSKLFVIKMMFLLFDVRNAIEREAAREYLIFCNIIVKHRATTYPNV